MAPTPCAFCSLTLESPVALCFSPPGKATRSNNKAPGGPSPCYTPCDPKALSYIFGTLGIKDDQKGKGRSSFPACYDCVETFQKIEKHFKIISNMLSEIKRRKASSPPPEPEPELQCIVDIKEETICDLEGFFLSPEPEGQEDSLLGELSVPFGEDNLLESNFSKQRNDEINTSPSIVEGDFSSPWSLRAHGVEDAQPIFRCQTCMSQFSTELGLKVHRSIKHGKEIPTNESRVVCEVCGKTFATKSILNKHMVYHDPLSRRNKKVNCTVCGGRFRMDSIVRHMKRKHPSVTHGHGTKTSTSEATTFNCEVCSKNFVSKYLLSSHMRCHKPKPRVKCADCGEHFSIRNIARHIQRLHKNGVEKNLSCYFCGMVFKEMQHLVNHLRIHTKEKPFICPNFAKCGYDATRRNYLNKHVKTCGKEKDIVINNVFSLRI